MDKSYRLLRSVITVVAALISSFMLLHEDVSFQIIGIILFTAAAFLASILGKPVSIKIVCLGDKVSKPPLRFGYYLSLFCGIVILSFIWYLLYSACSSDIGSDLSSAIILVLFSCALAIFLLVPYVQALLILNFEV